MKKWPICGIPKKLFRINLNLLSMPENPGIHHIVIIGQYSYSIQLANPTGFSETAFFETGIMNNWKAKWISAPKNLE